MTRQDQHIQQLIDELMHLSITRSFPGKTHLLYETIRLLHETWHRKEDDDDK